MDLFDLRLVLGVLGFFAVEDGLRKHPKITIAKCGISLNED
jgi:hypothetical protein